MLVFLIVDNTNQKVIIITYPQINNQYVSPDIQLATFMWEDTPTSRYIISHGSTIVGRFAFESKTVIHKNLGGVS